MTMPTNLEQRVARLEQRADQLDRLEREVAGLRADFNAYRQENGAVLGRILATLDDLNRKPGFHWPWERAR